MKMSKKQQYDAKRIENKRFSMKKTFQWRYILVNGEYQLAKLGFFINYENGVKLLKLKSTFYEVATENGEMFLTNKPHLKHVAKLWREIKKERVDFHDVPIYIDETKDEAMKRVLAPKVYEVIKNNPDKVIILDKLLKNYQIG